MGYIIIGIIVAIIIIWAVVTNNSIVRKKIYIEEAWSSIDIQLKRKANVIPNLVDVLDKQTSYEGDLLTKLTQARSGILSGSNESRMKANDELGKIMPSLYAVSENYPTLGANVSFTKLMEEVRDCEDKIAYSRNRYNISVTAFNTTIKVFPASVIAALRHETEHQFFEIDQTIRDEADNMRIKDIK